MVLISGFLAVLDASTLGEFRKYAIQWQLSVACEIAGFFGVLSSELSQKENMNSLKNTLVDS